MGAYMTKNGIRVAVAAAFVFSAAAASAQTAAKDPSDRLREALPSDVAKHVLATIADARARQLPAEALEQRALKFAAKGVKPEDIARSVDDHAERMDRARTAIQKTRTGKAAGDEIEAGAEAVRQGVDGTKVSELAKSAPSGRSLAVPLYVIGSLVDRGLPSDEALQRVLARMNARASDASLRELPDQASGGQSHRPADHGGRPAGAGRPEGMGAHGGRSGGAGGPPAGVPANAGKGSRPATAGRGRK